MDEGYVIISDRYLYSNIAFQCAKLPYGEKREELAKWVKYFEFEYNRIPVPDLNLFLNVPFKFTKTSLESSRQGTDRSYLNDAADIHEADLSFQQKVREVYLWQVEQNKDFQLIDCGDENGAILPAEVISQKIIHKIEEKLSSFQS
jgi:dTMP kinase